MKILIVGGVAGGATAAARARRISETADITIVERGPYVSYANCGLPYYISRDIQKRSKLLLQTPEGFDSRYGVKVLVDTEAIEIDRAGKRVRIRGPEGESWLEYDSLILAQGGNPVMPSLPGLDAENVFRLWTVPDMDAIHEFVESRKPATAVIAGGGFIGLEMAEAFAKRGIEATVVELLPRLMSVMDPEFGGMIAATLESNGVRVRTGVGLGAVQASGEVELSDGSRLPGAIVLVSVGVRPELGLARKAGLAIGESGGLLVDNHMRTSDPHIWAAGDMVEVLQSVSGRKARIPLAGPANRQGRIAASNALGMAMKYSGALGSSVVKVFESTAASTGLTETAAREAGFDVGAAIVVKDHHAGYYPGGKELVLKILYDRKSARLLGAQAFGREGVEKRIDSLAVALHGKMTLDDLAEIDLAYAPPYSSANDPLNLAAFVGLNDISGFSPLITVPEVQRLLGSGGRDHSPLLLDVRNLNEYDASHITHALHIPVDELRFRLAEVPKGRPIVVYCRSGFRAHLALRILKQNGWADVRNMTGGYIIARAHGGFDIEES
ncbi:MAG: FAD-dependent oxidoreductase [Spirochaetia bacterium]|jgi:NADPH-dependent 2,4-dienoyl-CoA reductase/sulfur reductase-like enzyme/rhodanese-related sulfurtransferase